MAPEEQDAYRAFYRQVELHWSLRRESQIIVSPVEFEAIEQWYEAEIPLAVILRAIDIFIEKKKKAKRKRSFLLTHAQASVEQIHREYRTLHEGHAEEGDLLTGKLKALVKKLKHLAKSFPSAAEAVAGWIADLDQTELKRVVRFQDLEEHLTALDQAMLAHFTQMLAEGELELMRREVDDLLTEAEDPEFYRKMVQDAIRFHFDLPHITLLG